MAQKSFNLDDRRYRIMEEFERLYPPPKPAPMPVSQPVEDRRPWISEYFDDFVIVHDDGVAYKVPYTLEGEKVELASRSEWKEALQVRSWVAVKAAGDWELDVLAIPFNAKDSDGQYFDEDTEIMEEHFSTPVPIHQHGIAQGARKLQDKPLIVGRTVPGSLTKERDGWHLRVILNQALKVAKDIMDAARKGMVAVSSDSISHLARLEVAGKKIMYEKNRAGRIVVWPLAGISLWVKGGGNLHPASQAAYALPAMKAIYREAGLPFPELVDTGGAAQAEEVRRRARIEQDKAQKILNWRNEQ